MSRGLACESDDVNEEEAKEGGGDEDNDGH